MLAYYQVLDKKESCTQTVVFMLANAARWPTKYIQRTTTLFLNSRLALFYAERLASIFPGKSCTYYHKYIGT